MLQKKQHSFVIPDNQHISELVSLLENNFPVRVLAEAVTYRVFYDTFDWRLYKNGSVLEMYETGSSRKIYWRENKDGKLKIQLGLNKVPHLAAELAESEFRQQLQSVIAVRELIPQIKVKIKRLPVVVLGNNEKVVVRVYFDVYRYSPSRLRASKILGKRLTIQAVKGFTKECQQVETLFQDMKLYPAQDNILKLALVVKGVSTGDYTTRLHFLLDPEMPAEQALKKILLRLLEIMQLNTSGSINGRDIEYIHDYSNSLAQTCFALKQMYEAFPPPVGAKYYEFFSMLQQLTSQVRVIDELLLQLDAYQQAQKKTQKKNIRFLHDYLLHCRTDAHNSYTELLKSSAYRENISQWRDYLKSAEIAGDTVETSGEAVYRLADKLTWNIYQQALDESKVFVEDSNTKILKVLYHLFEKLCYLLEFFRSLYPATGMQVLMHELNALQQCLGTFKDLNAYIDIMQEFIKQSDNTSAIKACNNMIKDLRQQQDNAEKQFIDLYHNFASSYFQDKFREMFVDYHRG